MLRMYERRCCYMCSCKHVGVAEVIAAVLQRFSHTHILCYTVWGTEIGPAAAGPARHAPTALDTMQKLQYKQMCTGRAKACQVIWHQFHKAHFYSLPPQVE